MVRMNRAITGGWRRLWSGLAVALAMAVGLAGAHARQYEVLAKAEQTARRSYFSGRDLRDLMEILGLSEGQRAAAQELVQAYQASCRELNEACEELWNRLDESGVQSGWDDGEEEAYEELRHVFAVTSLELHRGVLADLRSLLSKEQEPRWERFERAHRRRSTLGWGSSSPAGGSDLIELVRGLDAALLAQPGVADLLGTYETELDRELVARNSKIEKLMLMKQESVAELDGPAPDPAEKLWEDVAASTRKIGALNRRVAASLAPQLAEEKQASFKEAVNLEFYPSVYGKRHLHRVLEAVKGMKDVDAAQREAIKGVHERHEREAQAVNERWVLALIRVSEETEEEALDEADTKEDECRTARRELDNRTVEAIKKILTEDQRKGLPSIGFRREIQLLKPQTVK